MILERLNQWIRARFFVPDKNTYLFIPINGAGLGHVSRSLAVAKHLKKNKPDAKIVFFATSIAVNLINQMGFSCYHIPPASLLKEISAIKWNRMFSSFLESIILTHRPCTIVFDGTMPYIGLRLVMNTYKKIRYVWIKRGLYKSTFDQSKIDFNLFDLTIAPGEYTTEVETKDTDLVKSVNPVSLLEKDELIEKSKALRLLRLDPKRPRAYVQLGTGNINGIFDLQNQVIIALKEIGVQVLLAISPVALKKEINELADQTIIDYPNSQYFSAFDFAVLAGGYNSVCEVVSLGLPTIFFPNTSTIADDQVKRVEMVKNFGCYESMVNFDKEQFLALVQKMLSPERARPKEPLENGAIKAANLILSLKASKPRKR